MKNHYTLQISPAKSGFFSTTKLEARISEPDGRVVMNFKKTEPIDLVLRITTAIVYDHGHKLAPGRSIHFAESTESMSIVNYELGELRNILDNFLLVYNNPPIR